MRASTTRAIIRAGLALTEALDRLEEDPDVTERWVSKLRPLRPVANLMLDVPIPPDGLEPPTAEELHRTWTCTSCGLVRITTALSALACPRCGQLDKIPHHPATLTEENR